MPIKVQAKFKSIQLEQSKHTDPLSTSDTFYKYIGHICLSETHQQHLLSWHIK